MNLGSTNRKQDPGKLPATEQRQNEGKKPDSLDDARKDSATITTPATSKTLPARTASTRIQEPVRVPSQMEPAPSKSHRSNPNPISATGAIISEKPERPGLQRRRTTAQTRYIEMLLGLDNVPPLHNILASFFTWILLAGYIVFPATFNKIQKDDGLDEQADSFWKERALASVRNVPLLYVAAFACGIGVLGCVWLWWKWKKNYVWVINRIFLPSLMNSIAGLISTLVNVYSAQDGTYSVTARATIIVTSACSVVTAALFLLYNTIMLNLVKRRHERETRAVEQNQGMLDSDFQNRRRDGNGLDQTV